MMMTVIFSSDGNVKEQRKREEERERKMERATLRWLPLLERVDWVLVG